MTTGLTFSELRYVSNARNNVWQVNGVQDWSLSDWMTALVGEVGEAANIIKKLNRIRDGLRGNHKAGDLTVEQLKAQLEDELADIQIYLDLLANRAGINLGAATIKKFNASSAQLGFHERLGEEYL